MTRVTNIGQRKRKFHETGFNSLFEPETSSGVPFDPGSNTRSSPSPHAKATTEGAPKKKRKRSKKKKEDGEDVKDVDNEAGEKIDGDGDGDGDGDRLESITAVRKTGKDRYSRDKGLSTETRRQRRINQRYAHTTCFACRQKGHPAKDCPTARSTLFDDDEADGSKAPGKTIVGNCYRCGSAQHTLSRCRKPVIDPSNPLPYASCFICSGKGHLASGCPQNQGKGIYPNGGSCKLCGDTTHLARNCLVGKDASTSEPVLLGTKGISSPAADEDDFHTVKRRRIELEGEEKRVKKELDKSATGWTHSQVPLKSSSSKSKVVSF